MRFTRLRLHNWRNFIAADIPLRGRAFVVGANASGKSNLLDALRFLRDVADPRGGGFQRAVSLRGAFSQIRSRYAPHRATVSLEVGIELGGEWRYSLEFAQGAREPRIVREQVSCNGLEILRRPDASDLDDASRLTQTHLEQVSANRDFREVARFLAGVRYLHLVPQIVREPERWNGARDDPFGADLLDQLARAQKTQRAEFHSRLEQINDALHAAAPQLKRLRLERDPRGALHLLARSRTKPDRQSERELSDGTLRLVGLLWSLLDGDGPLLLEEPELSLHAGIIRYLPSLFARRQVFVSTHSAELLADEGIALEEVLVLTPSPAGTAVEVASRNPEMRALVERGLSVADAVLPATTPLQVDRLALFGE
jgi:predicted ATPase